MTLRHMKIFVTVYQHSSVTKAAGELHLAQPSVSLAVKELEEYYGIRLFERIGRRICPTEAGSEFYSYALHIVSLFEDMEKKIKNWDTLGTIRIGTSITIGTHILPLLIKSYQEAFPSLRVEAVVNNSGIIEQRVLDNSIDLGLIETQPEHSEIQAVPFMEDQLCAVLPADHPLASLNSVTLSQMAAYPFLMREKGSAGREILEASFALQHLFVQPVLESSSTQAIVSAVSQGLGVAVLPYLLVERDARENLIKVLPFQKPLVRNLNIIYHQSKYLTPNMKAFIRLCREFPQPGLDGDSP